jgi:hypothetical protein
MNDLVYAPEMITLARSDSKRDKHTHGRAPVTTWLCRAANLTNRGICGLSDSVRALSPLDAVTDW